MIRKLSYVLMASLLSLVIHEANALTISVSEPVTISSAVPGIVGELDVYQVYADTGSADKVTAYELSFTGQLAQVQANFGGGVAGTPIDTNVLFGPAAVAQDSHFLDPLTLPGAPIPPPSEGLLENIPLFQPTSGFAEGLSSSKAAVSGAAQDSLVHIAQIVLAHGGRSFMSGTVAISGSSTPLDVSSVVGIPEPASILIASMGLIGLLAARRR